VGAHEVQGIRSALEELEAIVVNPSSRAERRQYLAFWIHRWIAMGIMSNLTPISIAEAFPGGAVQYRLGDDLAAVADSAAKWVLSSSAVLVTDHGRQELNAAGEPYPCWRSDFRLMLVRAKPLQPERATRGLHLVDPKDTP
jgi:hypothetical protein